jgi:hypothetical protein
MLLDNLISVDAEPSFGAAFCMGENSHYTGTLAGMSVGAGAR